MTSSATPSSPQTPSKEHTQADASRKLFNRIQKCLKGGDLELVSSEVHGTDTIFVVRGPYYQKLLEQLSEQDRKGFYDFELRVWRQEDEWAPQ